MERKKWYLEVFCLSFFLVPLNNVMLEHIVIFIPLEAG